MAHGLLDSNRSRLNRSPDERRVSRTVLGRKPRHSHRRCAYFELSKTRLLDIPLASRGRPTRRTTWPAVIRSLQEFQLGESSEGSRTAPPACRARRRSCRTIRSTPSCHAAPHQEEHRHAATMGEFLDLASAALRSRRRRAISSFVKWLRRSLGTGDDDRRAPHGGRSSPRSTIEFLHCAQQLAGAAAHLRSAPARRAQARRLPHRAARVRRRNRVAPWRRPIGRPSSYADAVRRHLSCRLASPSIKQLGRRLRPAPRLWSAAWAEFERAARQSTDVYSGITNIPCERQDKEGREAEQQKADRKACPPLPLCSIFPAFSCFSRLPHPAFGAVDDTGRRNRGRNRASRNDPQS